METTNALRLIPGLKRNFFNESPADFIFSIFGWGYILIMYVLAFVFGFIFFLLAKVSFRSRGQVLFRNLGLRGRVIWAAAAIALLLIAIFTTWNPVLLFVSGFFFFQAVVGRSVLSGQVIRKSA
jgi:hypothetical protein